MTDFRSGHQDIGTRGDRHWIGAPSEAEELRGAEDAIAQDWDIWSRSLGAAVQPILSDLADNVPSLRAALFCTADGFNLCTLGVIESNVGRLSALTSSVFSVAGAHRKAIMAQSEESTVVNISSGDSQTVLLAVDLPGLGHFVLGAYADDISLGLLIIEARRTARRIASHLTVPIP